MIDAALHPDDRLALLVDRYLDGVLSADESTELNAALLADADTRDRFVDLMIGDRALAEAHRNHPAQRRAPIPVAPARPASAGRTNSLHIAYALAAALLLSAAAVAIYVVAASRPESPVPSDSTPIATLIDATGPVLVDDDIANPGADYPAGRVNVESGSADFHLRSGAAIQIRGATRLAIRSPLSVAIERGSATITCPPNAVGFTVVLPDGARVVDLGTRFEVHVSDAGDAAVRVLEGAVEFHPPAAAAPPRRIDLAGSVLWSRRSATFVEAEWDTIDFVRPSELTIDLVDVVAGGDGLGDSSRRGIDPLTGVVGITEQPAAASRPSDSAYHRVRDLPMVDGVFVPIESPDGVVVDSLGHRFDGFTGVEGVAYDIIWAGIPPAKVASAGSLGDVEYRERGDRWLWMHANKAVTFDLRAVTDAHGLTPRRLTARAVYLTPLDKLPADRRSDRPVAADVWVLVDGRPRFVRRRFNTNDGPIQIDLELTPNDRMLTLAITDGGDGVEYDWVVIDEPTLTLTDDPQHKTE